MTKSTRVIAETHSSPHAPSYDEIFKKDTAFISISGVGSQSTGNTCIDSVTTGCRYIDVKYGTKGVVRDAIAAFQDMRCVNNQCAFRVGNHNKDTQERVKNLTRAIVDCLTRDKYKYVVVIGCSHGSLIVHAAFLHVQMMVARELLANKLFIFTVSSPYYLPKDLVPQATRGRLPKLVNAYHKKDPLVNTLQFSLLCNKLYNLSCSKVPDLSMVKPDTTFYSAAVVSFWLDKVSLFKKKKTLYTLREAHTGKYHYDPINATMVIDGNAHIQALVENTPLAVNDIRKWEIFEKPSMRYHHATTYLLVPMFAASYLTHLRAIENTVPISMAIQEEKSKKEKVWDRFYTLCSDEQASSIIRLTDTKRTHKVYERNDGTKYIKVSGENVLLSSIRGKYRYVRDQ